MERKIVKANDGTVPAEDILCTTYQMRNFYRQFADGFASVLDVMNYSQHLKAAMLAKKGDVVLDVCCGRGLLLPLLRYYAKEIEEYVGLDIHEPNMDWREKDPRTGKRVDPEEFYPFKTRAVVANVADVGRS